MQLIRSKVLTFDKLTINRRDRGPVPVTCRCLKPGEDFSPDEFIGAVADELRDALEGLVEKE